jgi:hypothetical protein
MTETEKIQRRYESKYYPKVRKVIQGEVDYTANVLEREGFSAAIKYAEGNLFGIEMMNIVKQLYIEIGGMFARRTWIDLNKQKRKGFGFRIYWIFSGNIYLTKYLLISLKPQGKYYYQY